MTARTALIQLAAAFALLASGFTAKAVDLTAMEVQMRMNPSEYRTLMERFQQADTTLTPAQLAKVYFGYSFTDDYDPTLTHPALEQAFDQGRWQQALTLATEALQTNPVSLDLNVMAHAATRHLLSEGTPLPPDTPNYGTRADLIATAILESGQGTDPSSPFTVISSSDMLRLLRNILGIENITDRTHVGPETVALKVTFPGSSRNHILYFNTSREQQYFNAHPLH